MHKVNWEETKAKGRRENQVFIKDDDWKSKVPNKTDDASSVTSSAVRKENLPRFTAGLSNVALVNSNVGGDLDEDPTISTHNFAVFRDKIWRAIHSSFSTETRSLDIDLRLNWQLSQYIEKELGGNTKLHQVLTITGTPERAQVSTCEEYVIQTWGVLGGQILDFFVESLELGSKDFETPSKLCLKITNPSGRARITLSKKVERLEYNDVIQIRNIIELFAWLLATFRIPKRHNITISKVKFEPTTIRSQHGATKFLPSIFQLSLAIPKQDSMEFNYIETPGNCWLPLFKDGVLAYGFLIAPRDGLGLDIPFQLMTLFAGTRGSILQGDRTLLVGPSRILFPVRVLNDAVEWHYMEASEDEELTETFAKYTGYPIIHDSLDLDLRDIKALSTRRSILGHYRHAFVTAGTFDGVNNSNIEDSLTPNSSSRLELAREGITTAGFSIHGATGNVGGRWVLPQSLQVSLAGNHTYDNRLENAIYKPLLVYDLNAQSAWLVAELSIVLHLAHKILSSPGVRLRGRRDMEKIPWPQIPYAELSADGGTAAHAVIQGFGHIPLYTRHEDSKPQELWNEIDNILKDFATIRTEEAIKRSQAGWQIRKSRLQGWDFNDLVSKEDAVSQRELPPESVRSPWWSLAEKNDMLVIFGRNFPPLVRPDLGKSKPYVGWESVPNQADFLTASMPVLRKLMAKYGNTCELAKGLFWQRPAQRACPHLSHCTEGCLYIQNLEGQKKMQTTLLPDNRLIASDAVIFGDTGHYHECLKKVSQRTNCLGTHIVNI